MLLNPICFSDDNNDESNDIRPSNNNDEIYNNNNNNNTDVRTGIGTSSVALLAKITTASATAMTTTSTPLHLTD